MKFSLYKIFIYFCLASWICFGLAGQVFAQITVNILAVNATNEPREKSVEYVLPKDISAQDVLDTAGLKLEYKVDKGAYYVYGTVQLAAKETKTLKVRIKDVWQIEDEAIEQIKTQIDISLNHIKDTEYYENGLVKKDTLLKRLDYIQEQQQLYSDNATKRIERFKVYEAELAKIRSDAVSINFWRSKIPEEADRDIVRLAVEAQSPSNNVKTKFEHKHYLPAEVKPEHIVDIQDFDLGFDDTKGQLFLSKEEEFEPGETRRYNIDIVDVWTIPQVELDNLKERTSYAHNLLKTTEYVEAANYLAEEIKIKLDKIEASQAEEKDINQHISDYHFNNDLYVKTQKDVQDLENLLNAARENLERSLLKNVLQKLKALKSIREIAASLFKKPQLNTAWRIIAGIMIFVAFITAIHFLIWGKRSREAKQQEETTEEPKEESKEST